MKLLPVLLTGVLSQGGDEASHEAHEGVPHDELQREVIEHFLANLERTDTERAKAPNCNTFYLPQVIDGLWKCNAKERCRLKCQTPTKPPKTFFRCERNRETGSYEWVKKSNGDVDIDMCKYEPVCGLLGVVQNGVWDCNKKQTTCRLKCPHYDPDEGTRVVMKCSKKKEAWFSQTDNYEKKMNCVAHKMYDTEMIGGFTVHILEGMDEYRPDWRETLTRDIERVIDALPGDALETVLDTRIYLEKKFLYPGETDSRGAAVYHPGAGWLIDNGNLPEKARCIELQDVSKYIDWRNSNHFGQPLMLLHEFTHAYHHRVLNEYGNEIRQTYNEAMAAGLYSDVYANTNDWEYLAETSEAFFSSPAWTDSDREPELKNDLFPYTIEQLKGYDANGYSMLEEVWGVDDGGRTGSHLQVFCWRVHDNPKRNTRGYKKFTKYIRVLDCFDIYGEDGVSDLQMRHAASVAAELLDNDEDGQVDDEALAEELRFEDALIPIFVEEGSPAEVEFERATEGASSAVLYTNEMNIEAPGSVHPDKRDATVEEILHCINDIGHAVVYPEAFDFEEDSNSLITQAMDVARGGRFIDIPDEYPAKSWYGYDDETCDYNCMGTEYMYWGIVANMGILANDCEFIDNEWRACLIDDFRRRDFRMYNLIKNYNLPQWAPNGNYRGSHGSFCNHG